MAKDLPDEVEAQALVDAIIADSVATAENEAGCLIRRMESEEDEGIKASLEHDIEILLAKKDNLVELLTQVWKSHGIIAKPTLCDGDCGVHMAMAFGEPVPATALMGRDAGPDDLQQVVAGYRNEIASMWCDVANDCLWQQVWQRFVEGRVDLQHWRKLADPVATPPRKKRRKSMSFTPDGKRHRAASAKKTPKKPKLIPAAEADMPPESVAVVADVQPADSAGAGDNAAEPKPKKRTGKSLPPEQKITFEKCLVKYLAEKKVTYLEWKAAHRDERHVLVYLGNSWYIPWVKIEDIFIQSYSPSG